MIVCFGNAMYMQTESDIRYEFMIKHPRIEVESRTFSTDDDPTTVIDGLFVSQQPLHNLQLLRYNIIYSNNNIV
jgi:hypothetical protein